MKILQIAEWRRFSPSLLEDLYLVSPFYNVSLLRFGFVTNLCTDCCFIIWYPVYFSLTLARFFSMGVFSVCLAERLWIWYYCMIWEWRNVPLVQGALRDNGVSRQDYYSSPPSHCEVIYVAAGDCCGVAPVLSRVSDHSRCAEHGQRENSGIVSFPSHDWMLCP